MRTVLYHLKRIVVGTITFIVLLVLIHFAIGFLFTPQAAGPNGYRADEMSAARGFLIVALSYIGSRFLVRRLVRPDEPPIAVADASPEE